MNIINELTRLAKSKGLDIIDHGNGHIQIVGGPLLVNYYPNSKRQTAYVAATQRGVYGVNPNKAIELAFNMPDMVVKKVARKKPEYYRRHKRRLFRIRPNCHWCNKPLTMETATLEHIIPLKRGGLEHRNNYTLACAECNRKRGHDMPEIGKPSK